MCNKCVKMAVNFTKYCYHGLGLLYLCSNKLCFKVITTMYIVVCNGLRTTLHYEYETCSSFLFVCKPIGVAMNYAIYLLFKT